MVSKLSTPASAAPAAYLRPEGLAFLRNLARYNDREWLKPRKAIFDGLFRGALKVIR